MEGFCYDNAIGFSDRGLHGVAGIWSRGREVWVLRGATRRGVCCIRGGSQDGCTKDDCTLKLPYYRATWHATWGIRYYCAPGDAFQQRSASPSRQGSCAYALFHSTGGKALVPSTRNAWSACTWNASCNACTHRTVDLQRLYGATWDACTSATYTHHAFTHAFWTSSGCIRAYGLYDALPHGWEFRRVF